jgi:hypothetical protein
LSLSDLHRVTQEIHAEEERHLLQSDACSRRKRLKTEKAQLDFVAFFVHPTFKAVELDGGKSSVGEKASLKQFQKRLEDIKKALFHYRK